MSKNIVAFVSSVIFTMGAVILIKDLVKTYNIPVFVTVTVAIFSSYILMFLSVLYNVLFRYKNK